MDFPKLTDAWKRQHDRAFLIAKRMMKRTPEQDLAERIRCAIAKRIKEEQQPGGLLNSTPEPGHQSADSRQSLVELALSLGLTSASPRDGIQQFITMADPTDAQALTMLGALVYLTFDPSYQRLSAPQQPRSKPDQSQKKASR